MKKTVNFNKGFLPCAILSCIIIIAGIAGFFIRGINLGLDFKPGFVEEVRAATPVAEITYSGSAKLAVELSAGQMYVIISVTAVTNETRSYNFAEITTVSALASKLNKNDCVSVKVSDCSYDTT